MANKKIESPSKEDEKKLDDVLENGEDIVKFANKNWRIKWLHRGTLRKLSHVIHSCKKEDELTSRCASLIILNGWWKITLFHWYLWRWLWRNCSDEELLKVVAIGKKKVELQTLHYWNTTIFLTEMRDTVMKMNREEAERTLQELRGAKDSPQAKSIQN